MSLILHPATQTVVKGLLGNMPQSLLITGPHGVGISCLAKEIGAKVSSDVAVILPEKDDKIDLERGIINVDMIRDLYARTRTLKTKKQVIIIDYAETMGAQAQNAFLKLLEEPGGQVYFILVTHEPSALLPTVRSRMQLLEVKPVTAKQTEALLDKLKVGTAKRQQLLFVASGLPAKIVRLVGDEAYFAKRAEIIRDAKDLLQATSYNRLKVAQKYANDRDNALMLIDDAIRILRHSISQKPQPALVQRLDELLDTYQKVKANGNIRLNLARFVL